MTHAERAERRKRMAEAVAAGKRRRKDLAVGRVAGG